jgi:SAM-dependent methyltransferase
LKRAASSAASGSDSSGASEAQQRVGNTGRVFIDIDQCSSYGLDRKPSMKGVDVTELKETIRERYAEAARSAEAGHGCGGTDCCAENGCCGNPVAVADLHPGETVLDLGSGGGIDVLLSARRVGPGGFAYGLDMTDEMLDLARRNAADAGAQNVEFRKGEIEAIPLPDASVDVVISNCVINLSTDKPAVLREMFRVLRPGGRVGITDVVAEDRLSVEERATRGSYVGCIAGALSKSEYESGLAEAGFVDINVRFAHRVADGMHSAIVQAVRR